MDPADSDAKTSGVTRRATRSNCDHSVINVVSENEKKIDLIDERLGGVEEMLQRLGGMEHALSELLVASRQRGPVQMKHLGSSQASPWAQNWPRSPASKQEKENLERMWYNSNPAIEQYDAGTKFEGNSSLAAHSAYAREFLESAVSHSTPEVLSSPKIGEALSSLKKIVEMQNQSSFSKGQLPNQSSRSGSRCDIRDLEMPPMPMVLDLLRMAKENPPSAFGGYIPFLTIDYFIEKCRKVYFCTDEYTEATFIIANFGLYSIFVELSVIDKDAASRGENQHYMRLCRDNLETALANLNMLMPATMESVMALALGAMQGIEISKPSVSWILATAALHMCQTLGFHRLSSMEHDPPSLRDQKQVLFWTLYTIINLISLRLGRASVIQDCEIGIPLPEEVFGKRGTWGLICIIWAKQAMIQNQVYAHLYSPAALNQPESERVSHARRLAGEMVSKIIEPFERVVSTATELSEPDRLYVETDKVSRLALLTLIYRAIPNRVETSPGAFIPECIETARAALEHHQFCVASLKETSESVRCSYMHWSIFVSPFVPFIVIFCNVITTSNVQDLARLEAFIASLQPLCAFSQSIDRLHSLCSVLGTVARLYVEAKTRSQRGEDQSLVSVGQEFDTYLGALGLAPGNMLGSYQPYFPPDVSSLPTCMPDASPQVSGLSTPASMPQGAHGPGSMGEMSQAAQLGNWFSGNQYMMGLLEEDMFQFNPNVQ
ncbi:hypothetical protein N7512_003093 [Penicillium capsulatum]|nr:hypothetical protein N7512_003093 [Penicillium capsulatum]